MLRVSTTGIFSSKQRTRNTTTIIPGEAIMSKQKLAMVPLTHQIGSSTITLTEQELSISVSHDPWTKKQWNWLLTAVFQLVMTGMSWVMAPSRASNASTSEGHPRWKLMSIDVISSLLFALLIRPTHPLRKLFGAIDGCNRYSVCSRLQECKPWSPCLSSSGSFPHSGADVLQRHPF